MTTTLALRTPDERFMALPGFSFAPHYVDDLSGYEGLRVHYLDEGPADAEQTFLCLHGEPTWSYLYRKMIPVFVAGGHRVVAPDFLGFGRSDKPVDDAIYTFSFHHASVVRFVERLDLRNVTLVCQDWGGLLGLTLPVLMPSRFRRLLVMNTALATGEGAPSEGFSKWKAFVRSKPDLEVGKLMKRSVFGLTDAEAAAYDAPFVDARYKAGVRRFPELVPIESDMDGAELSRRAATFLRDEWEGSTFMAVGAQDPVLGPAVMAHLRTQIRGCPEPMMVEDAGHFVQESGDSIARAALDAWGKERVGRA